MRWQRTHASTLRCEAWGRWGLPWVGTSNGGVSPLSLVIFFAAAKKVTATPYRGNARAA